MFFLKTNPVFKCSLSHSKFVSIASYLFSKLYQTVSNLLFYFIWAIVRKLLCMGISSHMFVSNVQAQKRLFCAILLWMKTLKLVKWLWCYNGVCLIKFIFYRQTCSQLIIYIWLRAGLLIGFVLLLHQYFRTPEGDEASPIQYILRQPCFRDCLPPHTKVHGSRNLLHRAVQQGSYLFAVPFKISI